MNAFVYRLASTTALVYRIIKNTVHNLLCGLQNIHKARCGWYSPLCCPQTYLPGLEMLLDAGRAHNENTAGCSCHEYLERPDQSLYSAEWRLQRSAQGGLS